jgi:hypothetical protein
MSLPPTSTEFLERTIGAANALRLAAHAVNAEGTAFETEKAGDGTVVKMDGAQCAVTFSNVDHVFSITMEPKGDAAPGFVSATVTFAGSDFPGSPLFQRDDAASDAKPTLARVYAELFDAIQGRGMVGSFQHDGEHGLVTQTLDGENAEIAGWVMDIARGLDAIVGTSPFIYVRHPGMGSPGVILPTDGKGSIYTLPEEDDPNEGRKRTGARIRLMREWVHMLPLAILLQETDRGSRTWRAMPMAMTFAAPDDSGEAMRKAMRAYAQLSAIPKT